MEWYKECQDLLHDFQTRDNSGIWLSLSRRLLYEFVRAISDSSKVERLESS